MDDISPPFVGTNAFQIAELRGFPPSAKSPRSSYVSLLATQQAVSRNATVSGLQYLQLPNMATRSAPKDEVRKIHHRTDKLLIKQHIVSDRQLIWWRVCCISGLWPFFPSDWQVPTRSAPYQGSPRDTVLFRSTGTGSPKSWTGMGLLTRLAVLANSTNMLFATLTVTLPWRSLCWNLLRQSSK
jgi:hypothetical protein